jgi:hypothetical protein
VLFACFCFAYYSIAIELKLSLHSRLLIWNWTNHSTGNCSHEVFNSHDQIFFKYKPSAAVCYRKLTSKRASVSLINPWSDTQETLLPTVLLLLRHCWNAWRHCWRGHVIPPHSCVIQVFIAVAWQRARRGDARRGTTPHGTAELGSACLGTEKTPVRLLLRNRGKVFLSYGSCMA